jgi:hypothetical protein
MSLQYWDKEDHKPTLSEVLDTLQLALTALSTALPLAIRVVGSRPIKEQVNFWNDLLPFANETDLFIGDLSDFDAYATDIDLCLMEWGQFALNLKGKELEP